MSNRGFIAIVFALGIALWLFSDELIPDRVDAAEKQDQTQDRQISLVRGIKSVADKRTIFLSVRGQTRENRRVQVKSEISGVVESIAAEKGAHVNTGDLLCQIAVDSRQSDLNEARANLKSAQLEYDGIFDLNKRGLQSEIVLAKARAILEQSRANQKRAELSLRKTRLTAPFDGIVEGQPVEVGDLLAPGSTCVTIIEVDPMLVVGQVAERNIGSISEGDEVEVALITGETYLAKVTFISRAPEATTRTYPIEAMIIESGDRIRAGLTANMRVPVGVEFAHLISPASLILDDDGVVGIRIVDDQDTVRFKAVKVVSEDRNGVWVTGLPERVNVITIGQEEVFDGQVVQIDFAPLAALVTTRGS